MTGDPKRWLDAGGGATELERDLLRDGSEIEPPSEAHGAVWAALATRLPPVGGDPSGGGSPGGGGSAPVGSGGGGASLATAGTKTAIGGSVLTVGAYALRAPAPESASHASASPTQHEPPPPAPEGTTTPSTASALSQSPRGAAVEPRAPTAEPDVTLPPALTPSARQGARSARTAGPQSSRGIGRPLPVAAASTRPVAESQPSAGRIDEAPPGAVAPRDWNHAASARAGSGAGTLRWMRGIGCSSVVFVSCGSTQSRNASQSPF